MWGQVPVAEYPATPPLFAISVIKGRFLFSQTLRSLSRNRFPFLVTVPRAPYLRPCIWPG